MPHRRIRRNISVVLVVQQQHIRGIRTPLHKKPRQSSSIKNNHTKNETGRNGTTADPTKPRQRPWHRDSRVPPIQPAVLRPRRFFITTRWYKTRIEKRKREDSASRQRKKRTTNIREKTIPTARPNMTAVIGFRIRLPMWCLVRFIVIVYRYRHTHHRLVSS